MSCSARFYSIREGEAAAGGDQSVRSLEPVTRSHSSSPLSGCQYKTREMTQENSSVLNNHGVHPTVFRTICYRNDHAVICSTARKRNLYLRDWWREERTEERDRELLSSGREKDREREFEELGGK